jgi:hypothetical protein
MNKLEILRKCKFPIHYKIRKVVVLDRDEIKRLEDLKNYVESNRKQKLNYGKLISESLRMFRFIRLPPSKNYKLPILPSSIQFESEKAPEIRRGLTLFDNWLRRTKKKTLSNAISIKNVQDLKKSKDSQSPSTRKMTKGPLNRSIKSLYEDSPIDRVFKAFNQEDEDEAAVKLAENATKIEDTQQIYEKIIVRNDNRELD